MNTLQSLRSLRTLAVPAAIVAALLAGGPAWAGTAGITYYTCTVNIAGGTNTCTDNIVTVTTASGVQRVLSVNLNPGYVRLDVFLDVCNPTNWWSHLSDSPTTNGFGGDGGSANHDAEAYTLGTAFQSYSMDNSRGAPWPSYRSEAVVPATGCYRVQWTVFENQIYFDDDADPADLPRVEVKTNRTFESAPYAETDSEDPTSANANLWYVALNRTVGADYRNGTGTNKACFVLSTTTAPSAATLSSLCP